MGFTKTLKRMKSEMFATKKNRPKSVRKNFVVDDPDETKPRDYDAHDVGRQSSGRQSSFRRHSATSARSFTETDPDFHRDAVYATEACVVYACATGAAAVADRSLPELLARSEVLYSSYNYAGALPLLEAVLLTQRAVPSVPPRDYSVPPAAVYTLKKIGCCQQELGNLQSSVAARLEAAEAWRAYKRLCSDKGGGEEGAGAGVWKGEYDLEIHNAMCRVSFLKKSKEWKAAVGAAKPK